MDNNRRIIDYFFRKYFESNQYDIKNFVVNKTTKFTNYTLPLKKNYLAWQGQIEIWRTMQRIGYMLGWWFGTCTFALAFIFFGGIELAAGQTGYELLNDWTWSCFGIAWFFFFLGSFLYFYPVYQYHKINQKYLPNLIVIFEKMQQEGYINPNINDYPTTIQVIYYHNKWWKARWDKSYPFKHYCMWFGFLSLRYFIGQYQVLTFPLTNEPQTTTNQNNN